MFRFLPRLVLILIVLPLLPLSASAQSDEAQAMLELRKKLETQISQMTKDASALATLREEGRSRTTLCKTCHGKDGMAVKPGVPNLAGQNPVYILDQFQRFKDGRRNDYLMSSLAKSFSDEDKLKVSLYYSNMPRKSSGGGNPKLLEKGKTLYTKRCTECHGSDAKGQEGYARLAGQQPDYVIKMLKEFRDKTGRRNNPWMSGVTVGMSDDEMEAVATYLANLN